MIPTPTYNVEIVPYESQLFEVWDFAEISFCLNYIGENTRVIIYMIDSIEYKKETVSTKTRENMIWLLENFAQALEDTIIITIANKQSEDTSVDIQDIGQSWVNDKKLMTLLKGHDWRIFSCNSLNGKGIDVVFDYLNIKLKERRKRKRASIISLPALSIKRTTMEEEEEDQITPWDNLPNPQHFTDQEFKQWFYTGKSFLFFDHECLIRIIYLTIIGGSASTSNHSNHSSSRHQFSLLHYYLKNITTTHTTTTTNKSIQYSETQTLFWIQMISFALLKSPLLDGEKNTFSDFITRCQLNQDCWKDYYTFKLFYSSRASKEFLPPDKKSLPNAFKSSSLALKGAGLRIDYQVL